MRLIKDVMKKISKHSLYSFILRKWRLVRRLLMTSSRLRTITSRKRIKR